MQTPDRKPDQWIEDLTDEADFDITEKLPNDGSHAVLPPPNAPVRWRRRILDWIIGALAMLVILFIAAWMFWTSITEPLDGPATSTQPTTPTRSAPPSAGMTPPADLGSDEVWLGDISLDAANVFAAGTPLYDVVGTGTDVTAGQNGLVARYFDMTATVPFDVVAAQIPNATVSSAGGGEARIDTSVEILGRRLPIGATGTVEAVNGKLVIAPTAIHIEGTNLLSELIGDALRDSVAIEYEIPGMPEGVVLQNVRVLNDGFRANLTGENVRLVQ